MEQLTLTTPEVTQPALTTVTWEVDEVHLFRRQQMYTVIFIGSNGEVRPWNVQGTLAANRMRALNKANLSLKSLHVRMVELAQTDGILPAGTITGLPD